jgi:hypothetical protein
MQNHNTSLEERLENIDTHSRRAWALTSMLQTYLGQDENRLSKEVMSDVVDEIWERLDAIGAELHLSKEVQS